MKSSVFISALIFLAGTAFGVLVSSIPAATASVETGPLNPSEVTFVVSMDEIVQNFVFGERFSGGYEKTLAMSDGSERSIVLTPMELDGRLVVRLQDGAGHTFMGPNGWTQNGNLLINLRNYEQLGPSRSE